MADPQNDAAAVTAAQPATPAQPATGADDGFERVSRADLQALHRERDRARGMDAFFQKANSYGLKRPEDLDRYGKLATTLKGKNLTMDQIISAFDVPEQEAGQPASGGLDMAAIEKHFASKGYLTAEEAQKREARTLATVEHKQAAAAEAELVKKAIADLAGEKPSARDKYLIEHAVRAILSDKRGMYPDGHPLKDSELATFDQKGLDPIMAEIKKAIALGEGEDLAKLGDEAAKGKTPTPAGASGSQTPSKPQAKSNDRRPGGLPSKADIEAAYKDKVAKRGQGPVSAAGR